MTNIQICTAPPPPPQPHPPLRPAKFTAEIGFEAIFFCRWQSRNLDILGESRYSMNVYDTLLESYESPKRQIADCNCSKTISSNIIIVATLQSLRGLSNSWDPFLDAHPAHCLWCKNILFTSLEHAIKARAVVWSAVQRNLTDLLYLQHTAYLSWKIQAPKSIPRMTKYKHVLKMSTSWAFFTRCQNRVKGVAFHSNLASSKPI